MNITGEMIVDLIINIVNILILFVVVRFLLYKPVKKFLSQRTEKIEAGKAEIEAKSAELDKKSAEYDALLSESSKANEKAAAEGEAKGREEAARLIAEANERAAAIISKAEEKSEAEHEKILENTKDEVAALALQVSGKLLSREITDIDNRRIVEEFLNPKKGD